MKYTDFTNLFSLQKTLRFELIPQGPTEAKIKELQEGSDQSLLQRDKERAEKYKEAKGFIDIYHRHHIEGALALVDFKALECMADLAFIEENLHKSDFSDEDEETKKKALERLLKSQEKLRKAIASVLTGSARKGSKKQLEAYKILAARFKRLKGKVLFDPKSNQEFLDVVREAGHSEEEFHDAIDYFKGFTTYFKGFAENRNNMYSDAAEVTAISNRIVMENLPRFLDNKRVFEKIKDSLPAADLKQVHADLELKEKIPFFFKLESFQSFLNQTGIDLYNEVLGGRVDEDSIPILQGLNQKINLYNQAHPEKRLPQLKPLYKQILSESKGRSFRPEPFESDREMLLAIEEFWQEHIQMAENPFDRKKFDLLKNFQKATNKLSSMKEGALAGVFVDAKRLSKLSHQALGEWDILRTALRATYLDDHQNESARERGLRSYLAKPFYSLLELEKALYFYFRNVEAGTNLRNHKSLKGFFGSGLFVESVVIKKRGESEEAEVEKEIVSTIQESYEAIIPVLKEKTNNNDSLQKEKEKVEKIKEFLDSLKTLQRHLAYLHIERSIDEKNEEFYSLWDACYEAIQPLNPLYNKVRNRLTRKPFSQEKLKLSFEHQNLLSGWVESSTENSYNGTQYGGYLFRKRNEIGEYDYFLGVSKSPNLFPETREIQKNDQSEYERLNYYQVKSDTFYRVFFGGENKDIKYAFWKEKAHALLVKFGEEGSGAIDELIQKHFLKDEATPNGCFKTLQAKHPNSFQKLTSQKEFKEINTNIREGILAGVKSLSRVDGSDSFDISSKYYWEIHSKLDEFLNKAKIFNYFNISKTEMNERLNDRTLKGLYFFKIANKDLLYSESKVKRGRTKRGNENLHTIYFKHLMSAKQSIYDIGTGQVFFRKASVKEAQKIVHTREQPIDRRTNDKKSYFKYDIVKDRRYTKDKFLLHLSTTLNYASAGIERAQDFNSLVYSFLKQAKNIKAIGIDRGERHLLYLSLIDEKGKILDQFSLNSIKKENAQIEPTNFRDKLDAKEKERKEARQNWDVIENIKELKEGYLSLVIHQIAKLMVKEQAILVMEDLNKGFKRGRFKVEKQVYQKFEKMLIDKLNYLVFKGENPGKPGGSLHALQLTSKFESFQKLGKQTGMVFYVPASYTSKIDPVTGFYNFLNPKSLTIPANQELFRKFDSIRYNTKKGYFEFQTTYGNFNQSAGKATNKNKSKEADPFLNELAEKSWTICSHDAERYRFKRGKNGSISYESVDCNGEFQSLLKNEGIAFDDGHDLREEIASSRNGAFLQGMIETLRVLLALRYNNGKQGVEEKDYILSPVADSKGNFFNSLDADESLPKDADANGAYHIAKKGLLLVEKIREFDAEGKKRYPDLYLSHHEWLHSLWMSGKE